MRLRTRVSAVAAVALFTASTFNFGITTPASAKGFFPPPKFGRFKPVTPPPVQAAPTVNVKDFGAVGDGTTDDTTSIQNAAAAAKAANQGLFFPPGTYLHNATLTFNAIDVSGAGPNSTVLLAGDRFNSAIILAGASASLTNIQVTTSGLQSVSNPGSRPNAATVLVSFATQFNILNSTITQGTGRYGIFAQRSSIGLISGDFFNGTASNNDTGVVLDGCFNISVHGNFFQNEDVGVLLFPFSGLLSGFGSQFISIAFNHLGTTTFPTRTAGVIDSTSNTISVFSNAIQMASMNSGTYCVYLTDDTGAFVSQNQTDGGRVGVGYEALLRSGNNTVLQNVIRNTGSSALFVRALLGNATAALSANNFGEAGLTDMGANTGVILVQGSASRVAGVQVTNNVYQGHANNLDHYIYMPTVPAANQSGNTQTQTTLDIITGP